MNARSTNRPGGRRGSGRPRRRVTKSGKGCALVLLALAAAPAILTAVIR